MPNTPRLTNKITRPAVVLAIALLTCTAAWLITRLGTTRADDFFYDAFYRLRPQQNMLNADVVLVAVDDASLAAAGTPWPWPRTYWGGICQYLDHAGAKVIAFDVVFPNPSYYNDDDAFATAINQIKTPIIFGNQVTADSDWDPFAPKAIKDPTFGAVNLGNDKIYRRYPPELNGQSSLAEAAVIKAG